MFEWNAIDSLIRNLNYFMSMYNIYCNFIEWKTYINGKVFPFA